MEFGEQFRYEPRIKNKPNAQGTLFQVHPSQRTPQSRQPRGYSRERYDEVGKVTGILRPAKNPYYGPVDLSKTRIYGHGPTRNEYAQTLSTLARSTIPLEHFESNTPHFYAGSDLGYGTAGEYQRGDPGRVPPRLHIATGYSKDTTAIHEMGHHYLHMSGWNSSGNMEPGTRGHDEGFADRYAVEHYRNPGYKRKPLTEQQHLQEVGQPWNWFDAYGYRDDYHGNNARNAFTERYNKTFLNGEQFPWEKKLSMDASLPKEHIPGQQPLIHKENPPWGSDLPTGWSINPEAMPK